MEDYQNVEELRLTKPITNSVSQNINFKKGFVKKYFEHLKWTIGVYHIFFAIWATFILFQALLPAINNLIFSIPIIVFIVTSAVSKK